MARKRKPEEHVNHERWLISYADFITLLFAFFVVMFAVSQVDSKKLGRFTEEFSKAIGNDVFPERGKGLLPGDEIKREMTKSENAFPIALEKVREELLVMVKKDPTLQGLQILRRHNELVLRLSDSVFFESGDDKLRTPAFLMLHTLAPVLNPQPVDIRVEGHTDDRPISNARFHSNWDLSTARSTAVLALLASEGIASTRLSAAGYGEFRPVATNATDDGRKQNRRVDLVLPLTMPLEEASP
jgi:chemotaxis protein MotB